jgi:anti-sigma regulatory factor (Ser/Thr protein kinase)
VTQTLTLWLSADAALLTTARLFAAGAARLAGCSDETVEDVRLAVSEACTQAVRDGAETGEHVSVEASIDGAGMEVVVMAPTRAGPTIEDDLRVDLIPALFEGAETTEVGGRRIVRFRAAAS